MVVLTAASATGFVGILKENKSVVKQEYMQDAGLARNNVADSVNAIDNLQGAKTMAKEVGKISEDQIVDFYSKANQWGDNNFKNELTKLPFFAKKKDAAYKIDEEMGLHDPEYIKDRDQTRAVVSRWAAKIFINGRSLIQKGYKIFINDAEKTDNSTSAELKPDEGNISRTQEALDNKALQENQENIKSQE